MNRPVKQAGFKPPWKNKIIKKAWKRTQNLFASRQKVDRDHVILIVQHTKGYNHD